MKEREDERAIVLIFIYISIYIYILFVLCDAARANRNERNDVFFPNVFPMKTLNMYTKIRFAVEKIWRRRATQ